MRSLDHKTSGESSLKERPAPETAGNDSALLTGTSGRRFDQGSSGPGLRWQVCLLLVAWGILCSLHWTNDGLFFQGDAPRHAINGLFWKDLLQDGWRQPGDYARSYFARYPVICPTYYPPVFYLVEAAAFSLFGASPYVAKGVVLAFSLIAGIYTLAWLREWIEPAAGAAAGLVLLMPGITTWSHAVMLDVPAMAFGVGALYHCRRALESSADGGSSRQLSVSAALATLGILTHPTIGTVVFVGVAWMLVTRRWEILLRPSTLLIAITCVIALLPVFYVLYQWGPRQFSQLSRPPGRPFSLWSFLGRSLTYYGRTFVIPMAGATVLVSAGPGLLVGLARPRWRRETILVLLWLAVPYLILSLIWAKDERYLLIACPALVCLIAIGALSASKWLSRYGWPRLGRFAVASLLGGLALISIDNARRHPLPSVSGFIDVVEFMEQVAPSEPVFYDGNFDGVYVFYLRLRDPQFQRQVVLVRKWIPDGTTKSMNYEAIGDKIMASGCRWLILEVPTGREQSHLWVKMRDIVRRGEFELVRNFAIGNGFLHRVEVYRIRNPANDDPDDDPLAFDMPQDVGGHVVRPIRR